MYNLRIKNHDTQITIINTNIKTLSDIVQRYDKLGKYNYEIYTDDDRELTVDYKCLDGTNIKSCESYKDEVFKILNINK